jgi:hypothetical protein
MLNARLSARDLLPFFAFIQFLSFSLNITITNAQIYSCPVSRVPEEGLGRASDFPIPLPTIPKLNFSSAEYGTGRIPFTTSGAYGLSYSSGSQQTTVDPTRNMPYSAAGKIRTSVGTLKCWQITLLVQVPRDFLRRLLDDNATYQFA